jgi:hypothetical protein
MTRPESAFAAPPPRKAPKVKRDTPDEAAEKRYVRLRDRGCVAVRAMQSAHPGTAAWALICSGPIEVDHVRASGGLGLKSETHRRNMVCLCTWHHKAKTDYGKTWRPLLIAYLDSVEGPST